MNKIIFDPIEESFVPKKGTIKSAGYDLFAAEDKLIVAENGIHKVNLGTKVKIPDNFYGRIAMRSGLAFREHLAVSAGVIDNDYTGTLNALIFCTKQNHKYQIKKGDRIAQLVIEKIYDGDFGIDQIQESNIHLGFGSTGK